MRTDVSFIISFVDSDHRIGWLLEIRRRSATTLHQDVTQLPVPNQLGRYVHQRHTSVRLYDENGRLRSIRHRVLRRVLFGPSERGLLRPWPVRTLLVGNRWSRYYIHLAHKRRYARDRKFFTGGWIGDVSDHRKRKHHQSSLVGIYFTQQLVILALAVVRSPK